MRPGPLPLAASRAAVPLVAAAALAAGRARTAIGAAQADIDAIAAGPGCTVLAAGTMNLSRSVLFSWTGSGWRRISSVTANSTNLYAIAAPAAGSTWAVGYTSHGAADQTLILRKTAGGWVSGRTPDPACPAGLNDLYGVAASGAGAWAVGSRSVSATAYGVLILGWNGQRWVVARVPRVAGARDSALFSAAAISPSSAWAVGTAVAGAVARPLIERFQRGHWAIVGSPAEKGELESVTVVSARNAWAVGYRSSAGGNKTLIEHWNGSGWMRAASPDPVGSGGMNELQGVAASAAAAFWIAGSYVSGGVRHSFALHRS